jgi:hypothetical protein
VGFIGLRFGLEIYLFFIFKNSVDPFNSNSFSRSIKSKQLRISSIPIVSAIGFSKDSK